MPKLKRDNIAIIVAVVLILAYIIFQFYSVSHVELETQTATLTTVYDKIDAVAVAVRDESVINTSASGVTVPCLADGDKARVKGNVAMTFSSADAAEKYSQYSDIQEELRYYENLESMTVGQVANVETLDSEIGNRADEYIRTVSRKNVGGVAQRSADLNESILRRQMLIGENVDLMSTIQDLRQKSQKLGVSKPDGYITTDKSGVFSSYTDGYENTIGYDNAENMSIKDVKSALKKFDSPSTDKKKHLGKLVTSYKWYFMCVVPSENVKNLDDGYSVDVALKGSADQVIKMTIVSGANPAASEKETALILKSSTMNAKLATIRKEEIEIRINSKEGIKVPASALHVENGKKGVYALISSQVRFREVEVIYSDEDYVLLDYIPDNNKGIRLYDKIITQGKGLSDGKVYT
ncbi:MAG: hypothetical protein IJ235_05290 [Eubacterium sp.]|nr:hypothetical protein [Eubacterium sp.]MBQ8980358.1 hypothetical protein [Eubacterium sp.]MBR1532039.1 hypothetical protein [Eubacterium sp.]MBR2278583.1 hypothetical protein [Eubacterium sp.]